MATNYPYETSQGLPALPGTLTGCLSALADHSGGGITLVGDDRGETTVSYAELCRRALAWLGHLQARGVRPGDEMVLQLPGNEHALVAFWACILGGIVPIPLLPAYNPQTLQRLMHVMGRLRAPWVMTVEQGAAAARSLAATSEHEQVRAAAERVIVAEQIDGDTAAGTIETATPDSVAFVQFSSGSTGSAHGVVLTHGNLLANIHCIREGMRGEVDSDRSLSWMPLTHDMGLIGLHLVPAVHGVDHTLIEPTLFVREPQLWLDEASRRRATVTAAPNFAYKLLLRSFDEARARDWDLSCIRLIFNGAEPISTELCRAFVERLAPYGLSPTTIFPVYGLAEATLAVTFPPVGRPVQATPLHRGQLSPGDQIRAVEDGDRSAVPLVALGRPLTDMELRIAGESGAALADGRVGEIQLRGPSITPGYYRDDEATEQVFTTDGWLRTGDLGVIHAGELMVVGRSKDVIIVHGANHHPADLEGVLLEVEGVELGSLVVVGVPRAEQGSDAVVAFVRHKGTAEELEVLRESMRAHLIRQTGLDLDAVIPLDRIPRTTSGKVQRFDLVQRARRGDFADLEPALRPAADQGDELAEMRRLWSHILAPAAPILDQQTFIELGGRSLQAMRLIASIERRFGARIPIGQLFEGATVASLAAAVRGSTRAEAPPIHRVDDDAPIPATAAQRRLWVLHQLGADDSRAYNVPVAARVEGPLDPQRLRQALRDLVQRHEALRTTVIETDRELWQSIAEAATVELTEIDGTEDDLAEIVRGAIRPFDLSRGPLMRCTLVRLGPRSHVVVLDVHHIVADGMSMMLLVDDLLALMGGAERPAPDVRYRDACALRTSDAWRGALADQWRYWTERFEDGPPLLELPTDHPRSATRFFRGTTARLTLDAARVRELRRCARSREATVTMVVTAAWALVLSRLSGARDLVIGMPVEGRRHPGLAGVVGMFVNTLPVRLRWADDLAVGDLISAVRRRLLEALENQELPLDELVDRLGLPRDPSRNPLFDVMLSVAPPRPPVRQLGDLRITPLTVEADTSLVDLTLHVREAGERLELGLQADSELFEPATVRTLLGAIDEVLRRFADDPGQPLDRIELASPSDRRSWRAFNDTAAAYPGDRTVIDLLAEQVTRSPDAVAVVAGEGELTYGALLRRAEELAARLQHAGAGPGVTVALAVGRGEHTVPALLGALRSGAAYVPLDPAWPDDRLRFVLRDSDASLVVGDGTVNEAVFVGLPLVRVDDRAPEQGMDPAPGPGPGPGPEDLAYVLYTSGTTGEPKGVRVGHRNLVRLFAAEGAPVRPGPDDTWTLFHDLCFDFSVWELFGALLGGGRLVVVPEEVKRDPPAYVRLLRRHGVTVLNQTPSVFGEVAATALGPGAPPLALRLVVFGGERLHPARLAAWRRRYPDTRLVNMYGITEATVHVTAGEVGDEEIAADSAAVGHPLPTTTAWVLDARQRLLPPGLAGEIAVGGEGLALGYHRRPELDSARFVVDPRSGQRRYLSGDRGRLDGRGRLQVLGRLDDQVQLQGHRVELGEVEEALRRLPGVRAAAVVAAEGPGGTLGLEATVVAGPQVSAAALRRGLARWLPAYMIPGRYHAADALPLTAQGKVDRRTLAALARPLGSRAAGAPPGGALERALLGLWADVLGHGDSGPDDNFFEVGGNSLRLMQLHRAIEDRWRPGMRPVELMLYPTARAMARRIARLTGAGDVDTSGASIPPVAAGNGRGDTVAIVGMALRIGPCATGDELWDLLSSGTTAVGPPPPARWSDLDEMARRMGHDPERVGYLPMTYLPRIDRFDARRFRIPPRQAAALDPAQRLMLELSLEVLERAGHGGEALRGTDTGVFVGHSPGRPRYDELLRERIGDESTEAFLGTMHALLPGRLAYHLDLRGPVMGVDTACSSSLVALHQALRALRSGECSAALVGGVHLALMPLALDVLTETRSADGRTRAFAGDAAGFGLGEGAVTVLLRPLERALADGDPVLAVIRGSAVNHDGHAVGLTAPDAWSQAAVLRAAWDDAGVDPSTIDYIEAHGTATPLGDAVELEGVIQALGAGAGRSRPCALGSIKAAVGHLDAAAGLAGLAAAVLSLGRGQLPPLAHGGAPTTQVDWDTAPVRLVRQLEGWDGDRPRRCGVSSFGLSGTNVHVVLEEAPGPDPGRPEADNGEPVRRFESARYWPGPARDLQSLQLDPRSDWVLAEHVIGGRHVLPGAAVVDLLASTGRRVFAGGPVVVEDLELLRPLVAPADGPLRAAIEGVLSDQELSIVIRSTTAAGQRVEHVHAFVRPGEGEAPRRDLDGLRAEAPEPVTARMRPDGPVQTGPRWRNLTAVTAGADLALATLELAPEFHGDLAACTLHPALLDVAMSLGAVVQHPGWLPVGLHRATVHGPLPPTLLAVVRGTGLAMGGTARYDVELLSADGRVLVGIEGLRFQAPSAAAAPARLLQRRWVEQPATGPAMDSPGPVLILGGGDGDSLASALTAHIRDAGGAATWQRPGESTDLGGSSLVVDLRGVAPDRRDASTIDTAAVQGALALCQAARAAAVAEPAAVVGLQLVFVGVAADPIAAAVQGLVSALPHEAAGIRCRCIEVDRQVGVAALWEEIRCDTPLHVTALREGRRLVPQLARVPSPVQGPTDPWIRPGGTVVITGGRGGIGRLVALELARRGPVKLALLGRTPPGDEGEDPPFLDKLARAGAETLSAAVDVADEGALAAVLDRVRGRFGPIDGVIHAAGVAPGGPLAQLDAEGLEGALDAKLRGTVYLDRLTRADEPQLFVVFSAAVALHGWRGQGDYCAANAFADAYVARRRRELGRGTAIAWPAWRGVGLARSLGSTPVGPLVPLDRDEALASLDAALAVDLAQVVVGRLDGELLSGLGGHRPLLLAPSLQAEIDRAAAAATDDEGPPRPVVLCGRDDGAYTANERLVASLWGEVLGLAELDIHVDLADLGGDSLTAMGVVGRVNLHLGRDEAASSLLTWRTIHDYAAHLDRNDGDRVGATGPAAAPIPRIESAEFYALSATQRRLFVLSQLAPRATSYNLPEVRVLRGELDIEALQGMLEALVQRHETLRTSFSLVDGVPVQRVHRRVPFRIEERAIDQDAIDATVFAFVRPFDLARAPLLRVELARIAEDHHLLMVDVHHIVADAFSTEILLDELRALMRGEALSELPLQYRDYAVWQGRQLAGGALARDEVYWLDRFADGVPVLDLPLDHPRPSQQQFDGDVVSTVVPPGDLERWRRFARDRRVTLQSVVLSGLFALLHRVCAQDDLIVASVAHGRTRPEVERLIGPLINLLPIRTRLTPDQTAGQLVEQVSRASMEALDHQGFPFDELVERLDLPRDLSRSPVADVLFSYMSFEGIERAWDPGPDRAMTVEPYGGQRPQASKTDLMLFCREQRGELVLTLEFATALFRKRFARRLVHALPPLVSAIVDAPGSALGELQVTDDPAHAAAVRAANRTDTPYDGDVTVAHQVQRRAAADPDAVAVTCGGGQLSFGRLQQLSGAIATRLREGSSGEEPGTVAVLCERRAELPAAMLGAMRAGWAYLPMDPGHPPARLQAMVEHSGARALITSAPLGDVVTVPGPRVRIDDLSDGEIEQATTGDPVAAGGDLAYVMYTSGTTGEPKGVEIGHRALVNFTTAMRRVLDLDGCRAVAALTTVSFDIAALELLVPLALGLRVDLVDDDTLSDVRRTMEYIARRGSDVLQVTPSRLQMMLDADPALAGLRSVTRLAVGGEPLSERLVQRTFQVFGGRLFNLYGPTETTVWSTAAELRPGEGVTAGRPVDNTRIHVVDAGGRSVLAGTPGEVWIAGDGVAEGYLGDAAGTARRFVPEPGAADGARAYRTGDVGRWRGDGQLVLLGRRDTQVKVRGIRVELAEIEGALEALQTVRAAVVVDHRDERGDVALCAYLVSDGPVAPGTLRAALSRQLPEVMIPAWFVGIGEIPLSINGKIDRRGMPRPGRGDLGLTQDFVVPEDGLEERIAAIWRRVLEIDTVGAQDNFFDLGGNSLKLVQVAAELGETPRPVELVDLFIYPTVRALVGMLSDDRDDTGPREGDAEAARRGRQRLATRRRAGRKP